MVIYPVGKIGFGFPLRLTTKYFILSYFSSCLGLSSLLVQLGLQLALGQDLHDLFFALLYPHVN
jgi:hypothetical protein